MFLSHAGENKPFAEALCDLLGRMGLLAFVDKVALKPGWCFTGFLSEVLIDVSLRQCEICRVLQRRGAYSAWRRHLQKLYSREQLIQQCGFACCRHVGRSSHALGSSTGAHRGGCA